LGLTTPTQGMCLMNVYSVVKCEERINGYRWGIIKPQKKDPLIKEPLKMAKLLAFLTLFENFPQRNSTDLNRWTNISLLLAEITSKWREILVLAEQVILLAENRLFC
jgi:hypothetical protein